jgi:hypothetical protein
MKKIILLLLLITLSAQERTPSDFWYGMNMEEKISFVNGVYAASSAIKSHHQHQVKEQYLGDDNWVRPYYIDRFYEIVDEHISKEVDSHLDIIVLAVDALYSNSDNANIPVVEAIRIVSMVQDGHDQKANLYLLKAQQRFK